MRASRSGNVPFAKVTSACHELLASRDWSKALTVALSAEENVFATIRVRAIANADLSFVVYTSGRRTEELLLRRCTDFGMTGREVDIVRLLCTGLSNAEIADFLFISPRTVENHLRSVYAKAAVNRRTQLLYRLMA